MNTCSAKVAASRDLPQLIPASRSCLCAIDFPLPSLGCRDALGCPPAGCNLTSYAISRHQLTPSFKTRPHSLCSPGLLPQPTQASCPNPPSARSQECPCAWLLLPVRLLRYSALGLCHASGSSRTANNGQTSRRCPISPPKGVKLASRDVLSCASLAYGPRLHHSAK